MNGFNARGSMIWVGCIVAAVVVMYVWRTGADSPEVLRSAAPVDQARSNDSSMSPPVPVHSPFASASEAAPAAQQRPTTLRSEHLRRKLVELRDPAEFIDYALQYPEDGGVAYARLAAVECRLFAPTPDRSQAKDEQSAAIVKAGGPNVSARLQALEQLPSERCRGIVSDPAMLDRVDAAWQREAQRDPVIRTTEALSAALKAQPAEQSQRLRDVLALQDPYALDHARLFAQDLIGSDLSGGQAYLDGKQYRGENMAVWDAAWSLVRCDFGERCDQEDDSLAYECAYENRCARSREELVASRFAATPARLTEVQELRRRLNEVVRNQQAEALLPPARADDDELLRDAIGAMNSGQTAMQPGSYMSPDRTQ